MQMTRTESLATRLNALLIGTLIILGGVFYLIFVTYSNSLVTNLSSENLRQESQAINNSLSSARRDLSRDIFIFSQSEGFQEVIQDADFSLIEVFLENNLSDIRFDHVVFLSPDDQIINLSGVGADVTQPVDNLLKQTLNDTQRAVLVVEPMETDEVTHRLWLGATILIRNRQGSIVGALYGARILNENTLDEINLSRTDVELRVLYNSTPLLDTDFDDSDNIPLSNELLAIAQTQHVARPELIFTEAGDPFLEAYIPVSVESTSPDSRLVFLSQSRYGTVYNFNQRFLVNALMAVGITLLVSVILLLLFSRLFINRPLAKIGDGARRIAAGKYEERIDMGIHDEIGQLADSFNRMAEAIQKREQELTETNQELNLAREKAEEANQAKSVFLASTSHELRTPLNAILNMASFLKRGIMGDVNERQIDALNIIWNSGDNLLNLINDVLDMSKIESGALNLYIQPDVDLKPIILEAMDVATSLAEGKDVQLESTIVDDLPLIDVDVQRMTQVLLNLLSNAIKFTNEGSIHLKVSHDQDGVLISVSDTGVGIAEEDFELVFKKFEQTESGLKSGAGTGLGMPITKSLVEAHSGHIWLESEINVGTTFFVRLPVLSVESSM